MYQLNYQLTITDTRDLQQIKMTNQLYSSNITGKCKFMTYKKWKPNQQVTEIVHAKLIM